MPRDAVRERHAIQPCGRGRPLAFVGRRVPSLRGVGQAMGVLALAALALIGFAVASPASAQSITLSFGEGTGVVERALQLIALLTVLSLAPSILVMVTSFTRIVIVLSLLRTALGTATAPPNGVMISLALFLTVFIMAPTFQAAYDTGVQPLLAGEIDQTQAFERGVEPFRAFMLKNTRDKDIALFLELAREARPESPDNISLRILIPAFMISELKRAFEIGFLLFVPFLIIDLVVASILMSMGMMMLPPVVVSLPFKLIFFVLVDGWNLIAGSLVKSFGP